MAALKGSGHIMASEETTEGFYPTAPNSVVELWHAGLAFLRYFGWYLLVVLIVALYLRDSIEDKYYAYREAKRKKNDDWMAAEAETQAHMRAVRQRQQQAHEARVALAVEERAKLETAKRDRELEEYDRMQGKPTGFRLDDKSTGARNLDQQKPAQKPPRPRPRPRLRQDDSLPLGGFGGSSGFRSSRPTRSGGGA